MLGGFLAARRVVRIMTGDARQRAVALLKTSRSPKPVSRAGDLEFVVITLACSMIEVQNEIR